METEQNIILKLNKVSRSFNKRKVIDSVSLKIEQGNFFAIIGSNGAGKSTLLRLILGDYEIHSGNIQYFNQSKEVKLKEFLKNISFSAPYFNLYEEFNLQELIKIYCEFREIKYNSEKFKKLLNDFSLSKHSTKQIKYYSSGMKQRAKLLLSFYSDSDILILDEPSTNLDTEGIDVLFAKLIEFKEKKKTVIIASNEPKELELCEESYLL